VSVRLGAKINGLKAAQAYSFLYFSEGDMLKHMVRDPHLQARTQNSLSSIHTD